MKKNNIAGAMENDMDRELVKEDDVLKILQEVNPAIRANTDLISSGDYNSIEVVTMIAMLEEAFDREIDIRLIDERHFNNVSSITRLLNRSTDVEEYEQENYSITVEPESDASELNRNISFREYKLEDYVTPVEPEGNASEIAVDPYHYPDKDSTIFEWMEHSAREAGNKTALCDYYGNTMTFQEVLDKSQAVGTYLHQKYGCFERPFVVCVRRNVKSLILFLGVLWSGNYYVALDETLEESGMRQMISAVNPAGILWHYNPANYNMDSLEADLYSDMELTAPDHSFLKTVKENCRYQTPLYGVFTSGTTGTPKCILKSHGAMADFITAYAGLFGFAHDDVLGSKLSLMFDAITKDLYTTLYCACTMHVMARGNVLPTDDAAYLIRNRITAAVWTPSLLINFCRMHILENMQLNSLRRILFVGEALPAKYMNYWLKYCPDIKFVNLYGTSEMTGNCLYGVVDASIENSVVPLNQIFPGYHVFVIDEEERIVTAPEAIGEIVVSGDMLCMDWPESPMEPEKFMEIKDGEGNTHRAYRTGDIVKADKSGNYIFLGRSDYRFKHAGYRMEPGEIEEVLMECQWVDECVVLYDHIKMRIVLFWTGDIQKEKLLTAYAQEKLPRHMLPGKYIHMDVFPLNVNGKIDRAGLNRQMTEGEAENHES